MKRVVDKRLRQLLHLEIFEQKRNRLTWLLTLSEAVFLLILDAEGQSRFDSSIVVYQCLFYARKVKGLSTGMTGCL